MILFPVLLNILLVEYGYNQYLIQDSFIKKSDFETTNVEVMLRFYELFDPSEYQNTQKSIDNPTVIESREIAEGHYEKQKYEATGDEPVQ